MWYHSQKYLYLVDYWCCCMSSEALLHKINKKWEIKKIFVTFQQILIFFLFQYLIALRLKFCLSWMLLLILQAALKFSWLTKHASFCHILFDHKLLWCLKIVVKSHDFHSIKFHESDWLTDSKLFLLIIFNMCLSDEQIACYVSQSFFEFVQQWLFLRFF